MKQKFVSNSEESSRMFQNSFFEAFSKIHFMTPLILFVPVVGYFMYETFFNYQLNIVPVLLLFLGGIFIWSFTEYVMHRFLFHYMPTSEFGKRLHFIFHGVHHDYPNDAKRLVMAPAVSIPLAFLYYYAFRFLLGEFYVAPFFSGFVVGYLFYDMTHYAIHHFNFRSGWWLKVKKHHMIHHYKDDDHGYGVSTKFWDLIFRSDFKK
jgi:4-hydroxysphinganine ceramide fatty acyl 2-hydroxylase